MKIVIIGTGNVAHVFGKLLAAAGHTIVQVFGRDPQHAEQLARELNTGSCSIWSDIDQYAEMYLIAVSDKALYELGQLALPGRILAHTAGSVSMQVLEHISQHYGVLYPLQSLRKEMPVLTRIPLLVSASDHDTSNSLMAVAQSMSAYVRITTDKERLLFHTAAVFVNNFTNHIYALAESFCLAKNIPFNLLFPLAAETTQRLEHVSPSAMATGPAVRNDLVTIQAHLDLLKEYPLMHDLYAQMTASIQLFHTQNDLKPD